MAEQKRVLIVEDEYAMARALSFMLGKEGYLPAIAADGLDALEQLAVQRSDVIILDLDLPRMNGFDLCRRLRAEERTRDIHIIVLTASPHEEDGERVMALGANVFMTKPFEPMELLERVREATAGT